MNYTACQLKVSNCLHFKWSRNMWSNTAHDTVASGFHHAHWRWLVKVTCQTWRHNGLYGAVTWSVVNVTCQVWTVMSQLIWGVDICCSSTQNQVTIHISSKHYCPLAYLFICLCEYIKFNKQTVQYGRLTEKRQYAYASTETIIIK